MERSHLKRRRGFDRDDPVEASGGQYLAPHFSSSERRGLELSSQDQFALSRAASITNISVATLLELGQLANAEGVIYKALTELNDPTFQPLHIKRARQTPNMPPQFPGYPESVEEQEKHQSGNSMSQTGVINGAGAVLYDTAAKVMQCVNACCNPGYDSDPGYQAVPTTSSDMPSYSHTGHYSDEVASPIHEHNVVQDAVPVRDGPVTQMISPMHQTPTSSFLPNFPSTQSMRSLEPYQPNLGRDGLAYQNAFSTTVYHKSEPDSPSVSAHGYHSAPLAYDRGPYGGDMMQMVTSPTYPPQQPISGSPSRYTPGYGNEQLVPDGMTHLQLHQSGPHGAPGIAFISPNQKPAAAKRGPFKDPLDRQQTATTRKNGSCIRCRMQRIRCLSDPKDERGICLCCQKYKPKMWSIPCMRTKISDLVLSKPGQVPGHEWTMRWKENSVVDDINHWASSEIKVICISDGLTDQSVKLRVRQFIPQEGDRVERSWVAGSIKKTVKIPPYAIVDLDGAKSAYEGYIKSGLHVCCKRILGSKDALLLKTYAMAFEMLADHSLPMHHKTLLMSTLELWMSIRLTTKSFEIVGNEKLGMPDDIMGPAENQAGMIPLPPVMGAQIDSVLIHHIQAKLRRSTLDTLQKLTIENRPRAWLVNYIATFILLHNIALVIKHDAGYARKHGMKGRFAREDKVHDYHKGAVTLLAYFHYCHKGIFPFSPDCKEADLTNLADLNEKGRKFVYETRRLAAEHESQWKELRGSKDYENDHYYVNQLFQHNWVPPVMDSS